LVKHLGFFDDSNVKNGDEASDEKIDEKPSLDAKSSENLKKSEIITIYNMSNNTYCSEDYLKNLEPCKCESVLFRTGFYKGKSPTAFFTRFCKNTQLAPKTILLFNVNELRRGGFNIHKGVSWEQLAMQTISALKYINKKNDNKAYGDFKAIVVCFNHEGCLIFSKDFIKLFFYPNEIEGDFVLKHKRYVFGPVIVMQAALALAVSANDPNKTFNELLCEGVKSGLVAMRRLVEIGFTENAEFQYDKIAMTIKEHYGDNKAKVQTDDIKNACVQPEEGVYPAFCEIDCTMSEEDIKKFSIIQTVSKNNQISGNDGGDVNKATSNWLDICKEIVTTGKTKYDIPYLRYKKLITYDKFEIEQLRNIHQLFRSYIYNTKLDRPLSICVFGPPGSGKSFAVEQIAASIDELETEKTFKFNKIFKFNVSQMKGPEELVTAFHQIRDAGLKGECPIVFFDEFDSKLNDELGWLKYFLAPMQDGEFTEEGHPHFIGRAIFIFAGGTNESMSVFKKKAESREVEAQKAKDFLSRLKGYINILGPNRQCPHGKDLSKNTSDKNSTCDVKEFETTEQAGRKLQDVAKQKQDAQQCEACGDKTPFCEFGYMLRRATLLRSLLEKKLSIDQKTTLEIADNVLEAFIKVDKYSHGSRSLEAIIQTSDIVPGKAFSASCINTSCLEMYVDKTFNDYLREEYEKGESNKV